MALEAAVFPHDLLFLQTAREWYASLASGGPAWSNATYGLGMAETVLDVRGVALLEYCAGGGAAGTAAALELQQGSTALLHLQKMLEQQQLHNSNGGGGNGCWVEQPPPQQQQLLPVVQKVEDETWELHPSPAAPVASPEVEGDGDSGLGEGGQIAESMAPVASVGRRKRRRARACKNEEEVENQRMTHIAVERNRRKQMNEYLAMLRSLMPPSYVQRGDQASIIGGAINFVKELEQLLQSLEAQKRSIAAIPTAASEALSPTPSPAPFAEFFTFPQYSTASTAAPASAGEQASSGLADIEVTMVESHANLKVLSRRRPRQLLRMLVGLQGLRLTPLHLNVTTLTRLDLVLYSLSLKVEEDCQLNSVDDIATSVYHMLGSIQQEQQQSVAVGFQ